MIFIHDTFTNNAKDRYLDQGNPYIVMNGATMKHFNSEIPDPLDPTVNSMMIQ